MREITEKPPFCEYCISFCCVRKVYGSNYVKHTGNCKQRHLLPVGARDGCEKFFPEKEFTPGHKEALQKVVNDQVVNGPLLLELYKMNLVGEQGITELGKAFLDGKYEELKKNVEEK